MATTVAGGSSYGYWDILPRRLVLISCAFVLGVVLLVSQIDFVFIALCFVFIAVFRVFNFKSESLILIALALAFGLLDAYFQTPRAPANSKLAKLCLQERVRIRGRVCELKRAASGRSYRVVLDTGDGLVQVNVFLKKNQRLEGEPEALHVGQTVEASGRLTQLSVGRKRARIAVQLMRKGIFFQMSSPSGNLLDCGSSGIEDVSGKSVGEKILAFHQRVLGEQSGSLLSSMVMGDRASNLDAELAEKFRIAGVSHVLAASGFNLSVVAGSIFFVVRFLGNVWLSNLFCLMGMMSFVFVAGPSPSVLRAFIMGTIMLVASCMSRRLHLPAALSFTMFLVLLFDPWSCADLGFQLSYFSTAAMILGAGQAGAFFKTHWASGPEWIRSALSAALVAEAAVLPLQLYYFGQVNSYVLLSNILVAPLVPVVTIAGFAASFVYLIEAALHAQFSIAAFVDRCCNFPLQLICATVFLIARAPLALVDTGKASLAAVVVYFAVLFSFSFLRQTGKLRLWAVLYALALLVLLLSLVH